jgi:hypothetical protein
MRSAFEFETQAFKVNISRHPLPTVLLGRPGFLAEVSQRAQLENPVNPSTIDSSLHSPYVSETSHPSGSVASSAQSPVRLSSTRIAPVHHKAMNSTSRLSASQRGALPRRLTAAQQAILEEHLEDTFRNLDRDYNKR